VKIIESKIFKQKLREITLNIKKDKLSAAVKFAKDLKKEIHTLLDMPYKYRKSLYHDDTNIRDMIFRGYTIIYKIDKDIIILEIFNQNLPVLEK